MIDITAIREAEMTPEQKTYYDKELARIRRGGSGHEAWAQKIIGGYGSENLGPVDPPVVGMTNTSDDYYAQYFRDRAELEAFITELRKAADEAWGDTYAHLRNIPGLRIDASGNVGIGS